MLERHFGLCAVLLCGAVLLGGCRTTNVGAETGTTPSSDTTEPGGSVTEPVTDQFETSMRIPADPDGVIPPTPRVWNASQVDNRRDSFEADTIDVCNSTYTVPQELQQKVFDVTGRYSYLLKCTFYAIDLFNLLFLDLLFVPYHKTEPCGAVCAGNQVVLSADFFQHLCCGFFVIHMAHLLLLGLV